MRHRPTQSAYFSELEALTAGNHNLHTGSAGVNAHNAKTGKLLTLLMDTVLAGKVRLRLGDVHNYMSTNMPAAIRPTQLARRWREIGQIHEKCRPPTEFPASRKPPHLLSRRRWRVSSPDALSGPRSSKLRRWYGPVDYERAAAYLRLVRHHRSQSEICNLPETGVSTLWVGCCI